MNVVQHSDWILNETQVKSPLPNRTETEAMTHSHFEPVHDVRDRSWFRNTQQEMAMIGHDDETVEEKWMKVLHAVEDVDRLSGIRVIGEHWTAITNIRRDKHHVLISNGMQLGHGIILRQLGPGMVALPEFFFVNA